MPRKNHQIPHEKQNYVTGCHDKRKFKTEREALSAADYQMLVKPGLELTAYRCDFCGQWHLTRQITRQR
jgi:hypothetical protein